MLPEDALIRKFEENIKISLKARDADERILSAFHKVAGELGKEGSSYSINRESFVRFFNDLSEGQQKDFLGLVAERNGNSKSVYDLAQEFNLKIMEAKPAPEVTSFLRKL